MRTVASLLSRIHLYVFSTAALAKWNDLMLRSALRARGYNNFEGHGVSGERHFVEKVLARIEPSVCVDVGANAGSYTELLLAATSARVYSFEPLAQPFAELLKLKERFGDRLIAVNKGVGAENGVLAIHYTPGATIHASFSEEASNVSYVKNDLSERVEVVSLSSFFSEEGVEHVDFLKIDTEGFELEVLTGSQHLIAEHRPKLIQIEFNSHHLFREQTLHALSELLDGYETFQMLPGRLARRDPKDPHANFYCFSNFVFARQDIVDELGLI